MSDGTSFHLAAFISDIKRSPLTKATAIFVVVAIVERSEAVVVIEMQEADYDNDNEDCGV